MNIARTTFLGIFCLSSLFAQTIYEGSSVFINDEDAIVVAADASVAVRKPDSPYIMLMLYMGSKNDQVVTIRRDDVVMLYKGQEYAMPTRKELRKNYRGQVNDAQLYQRMGKETLIFSQMKNWRYPIEGEFFPLPNEAGVDSGSMGNDLGFRTRVYFKNPGFKHGDEIVIKVKDRKKPEFEGAVAVVFN